jgi:hypothetical protein
VGESWGGRKKKEFSAGMGREGDLEADKDSSMSMIKRAHGIEEIIKF